MRTNLIYNEPCLETLSKMQDGSIDCVITSPPYWQLRDYGYDGQWGLEPTFNKYLENLWSLMDEIYRVLKPSGTCWVNLGDTYSTQSGSMGSGRWVDPMNPQATNTANRQPIVMNLKNKSLILIPHRFAIGCIDRGWIMRNDCIWAKRNGMPESVTDRFSKKHEYFFFMVKSEKYYFDLDLIRDKNITNENRPSGVERNRLYDYDSKMNNPILNPKNIKGNKTVDGLTRTTAGLSIKSSDEKINPLGKNPGSVADFWDIPTKPSSEKHYASYNDSLLVKPVLAGCPRGGGNL